MASTHQLKTGHFGTAKALKAEWIRQNELVNRGVRTVHSSTNNGCRYFSVCYSAPTKGWAKTHYGCRAHINLVGKDPEDVKITSVELNHTCLPEQAKRKRKYRMQDISDLSDAVACYQPTCNREGNAKQLSSIAKASTGIELGRTQAYRAVHERANDTIHAQIAQYMLLPDLFRMLQEQDPDGTHVLESSDCEWDEEKQQFKRCYVALSFMKHFWKKSCIRLIVIDGTHTKLPDFRHIILVAATYDANNEIVILSFAVVDVENKENWVWFQEKLQVDFPGFDCLMCDADKGITSSDFQLSQAEAEAVTSRCARHLAENCREACGYTMNSKHKNMILSLAKARTEESYLDKLEEIREIHPEWADWLHQRRSEFATYCFLKQDVRRWGKVTSNAVENVNSSLLDVRSLPILYLINGIIEKSQAKYLSGYRKSVELLERKIAISNHAFNYYKELTEEAIQRKVFITQERDTFISGKVSTGNSKTTCPKFIDVSVDTLDQDSHCSCMFFQEEGLRCVHIIALLRKQGKHLREKWWFAQRYHTRTYHSSYSGNVPVLALNKLEVDLFFVPPEYKRPAGRPARVRKDRSHLNKTDRLKQCSSCGGLGHSFKTCDRPSTQFRFEHHYTKALAWTKQYNNHETD